MIRLWRWFWGYDPEPEGTAEHPLPMRFRWFAQVVTIPGGARILRVSLHINDHSISEDSVRIMTDQDIPTAAQACMSKLITRAVREGITRPGQLSA